MAESATPSTERDFSLEAPDLEPTTIFDPSTIVIIAMISLAIAAIVQARLGNLGALLTFVGSAYGLYRAYRYVVTKLPPGYFGDKRLWLASKAYYYPGKPKRYPPLLK
jgi:hypothetical protein